MPVRFVLAFCASLLPAATVNTHDRYLPLIQDGGGWKTLVVVANPAKEAALVEVTIQGPKGFAEPWLVPLKASTGAVSGQLVSATLAPGASMIIETAGSAAALSRGFAVVSVAKESPVGAFARLVHTSSGGVIDQTLTIPLSPELEQRSIIPLFLDGDSKSQLVLVSETRAAVIELFFRDPGGRTVRSEVIDFGNQAQEVISLEQRFPGLAGFTGTLEWKVTFPTADIYEELTLSALVLTNKGGGPLSAITPMTLPEDQGRRSRH